LNAESSPANGRAEMVQWGEAESWLCKLYRWLHIQVLGVANYSALQHANILYTKRDHSQVVDRR